jgi:hypothetical protein
MVIFKDFTFQFSKWKSGFNPSKDFFYVTLFKGKDHYAKMVKAWQEALSKLKGQELATTLLVTIK